MNENVYVIGIAGGSGSGKTTFLRELMSHFAPREVALVSQDNYYEPKEKQLIDENGVVNFDMPTSIKRHDFYKDMLDLSNGQSIELLEYNFNNPAWLPEKVVVHPAPVIIMEGLFVFHYEEIRQRLDYKVYIDVHHEKRLMRRIARDGKERGYPEHEVRYQWENHVRPSEKLYLEPYIPTCDVIVDNSEHFQDGLKDLITRIKTQLGKRD